MISTIINFIYIQKAEAPWRDWKIIFSNLVSIILAIGMGVLILFTIFVLWPKGRDLKKKKYRKRYGSVYSMLRVNRIKFGMLFQIFFYIRRIIFALTVIFMIIYPTF